MFSRGLAFCLCVSMTSMAHAGAVVTLVPQTPGPYEPDQFVNVDVMLAQSPAGTARELRHVQLDFGASDPALVLIQTITHSLGANTIRFFDFLGEPDCPVSDNAGCGAGHFFDFSFTSPPDRQKVVSMTYYFVSAANLKANPNAQKTLPASAAVRIGTMQVRMPNSAAEQCYTLDALNAAQTNPDLGGADIRFGFGTDVSPDGVALTTWRANLSAPNNITGTPLQMCIGSGGEECTVNLASSAPNDQGSLWRASRNIMRLTFDGAIVAPTPGQIKIRKMVAVPGCGSYEADLSASFTYAVEPGNILRIREAGTTVTLEHRSWYEVSVVADNDWPGVCNFKRQYVVQVGDADANRFVTAVDVGQVNAQPLGPVADNSRFDINGDGFRTAVDVGLANGSQGALPAKPCGH